MLDLDDDDFDFDTWFKSLQIIVHDPAMRDEIEGLVGRKDAPPPSADEGIKMDEHEFDQVLDEDEIDYDYLNETELEAAYDYKATY